MVARPDISYERLPIHMQSAMRLYVEEGLQPGDFAMAVLSNDLVGAYGRADDVNTMYMLDWAQWLYNDAPSDCWGSLEKVDAYLASFHPSEEVTP